MMLLPGEDAYRIAASCKRGDAAGYLEIQIFQYYSYEMAQPQKRERISELLLLCSALGLPRARSAQSARYLPSTANSRDSPGGLNTPIIWLVSSSGGSNFLGEATV
eukprot:scaffold3197_cov153-Skeletonema_menzelii.AAC.17